MTADPTEFLEAARNLGTNCGAKPGPGQEKAYTDALLAQMRADKLLSVGILPAHGGPGLALADIARITYEIAKQDGSAGLIYAMHTSQSLSLAHHGEGAFFDALRQRAVDAQLLIASGTSEKGPGGDILTSVCTVEDAGDGQHKIVKSSPNISYIDHADLILVTAMTTNAKGRKTQVLVAAEVDRDAFSTPRETVMLGMRGIMNAPWDFTVTFAPEAVFDGDFGRIARTTMTPTIQILWAALWSGIADHVLGKARDFAATQLKADDAATDYVRHDLSRLIGKHHMMNALIAQAIVGQDAGPDGMGFEHAARINRLKVECSELLTTICTEALKIIGLRGYVMGGPYTIAQPIADALSGPIMVSNYRLTGNTIKVENYVAEGI